MWHIRLIQINGLQKEGLIFLDTKINDPAPFPMFSSLAGQNLLKYFFRFVCLAYKFGTHTHALVTN
jgi:hypothetical protein